MTRLRLGSRGSRLAVVQAEWVRGELRARDPDLDVEIVRITTTGDRRTDGRLADIGGKGLFLKELEDALLAETIDFAVHSMKDVPAALPPGLTLARVPVRADARDVLVAGGGLGLAELPTGARVGTASSRRRAQFLARRPDLDVRVLRGNVQTRLRKCAAGEVDVLVLAAAGLERLGLTDLDAVVLDPDEVLPAVGQGALALEHREGDTAVAGRLNTMADATATTTVAAERGFLIGLGGDCTTPLAAHGELVGDTVRLRGWVGDPDGRRVLQDEGTAPVAEAGALGQRLADSLLACGAGELLGR